MNPLTEFQSFLEMYVLTVPRPVLWVFSDADIQTEVMGILSLSPWPVRATQQRTGGQGGDQHSTS